MKKLEEKYSSDEQSTNQGSTWGIVEGVEFAGENKQKLVLEEWQKSYRERLDTDENDMQLKIEFNRFYRALSEEFPNIFPESKLDDNEIQNELTDLIEPFRQEILRDEKFGTIIKQCFSDDWYNGYLELAGFVGEKLYGAKKSPMITFSAGLPSRDGYYSHGDEFQLSQIVLARKPSKYDDMRPSDPEFVSVTKRPRDHFNDLKVILHEMWHAKQKNDMINKPADGRWKLYETNEKFYINPGEIPIVGLERYKFHEPPYQYTQQLVEREAMYFGDTLYRDIIALKKAGE